MENSPLHHLSTLFGQIPKLEDRQLNTTSSSLVRSSRQTRLVNFDSSFETFSLPCCSGKLQGKGDPTMFFCAGFPAIPLWDPLKSRPTNGIISREGARIIHTRRS
jgi:hypothetical protein